MSQLELFAARKRSLLTRPKPRPIESMWYDDTRGYSGVAAWSLVTHSPHWDWCTSGVWVQLERHFGWKPHRWMASVYLELPDEHRTYWSQHSIRITQNEAAIEADEKDVAARELQTRIIE